MSKYEAIHVVDTAQTVWNYSLFTDEDIQADDEDEDEDFQKDH